MKTEQWAFDENGTKNKVMKKRVMKVWSFNNFNKTFRDTPVLIMQNSDVRMSSLTTLEIFLNMNFLNCEFLL